MWCNIFDLFVGRNKIGKPLIAGNRRLNINIEGHIAHLCFLCCYLLLFQYKNCFSLVLLSERKKSLTFHGKDVDFADGIVLFGSKSFHNIIMNYIFQQLQSDIRLQHL